MRKLFYFYFFLLFSCKGQLFAQSVADSSRMLPTVSINAEKWTSPNSTEKSQLLDTTTIGLLSASTLSDQLIREATLFVKSYGYGGSSTISIRGMGASQTAVLWNGMNITNSMLGLADLTLIPSFLIDEVKVQYGGSGSILGSGAIGGAIHLDSKVKLQRGFSTKALFGIGNFGYNQTGIGIRASNGKVVTNTRFYFQGATNNFEVTDPYGATYKQINAGFKQVGASEDFIIGKPGNSLTVNIWYLSNFRRIPPGLLTKKSSEEQEDKALRFITSWDKSYKNLHWNIRAGWGKEQLNYSNPDAQIDDQSTTYTTHTDGGISYSPKTFLKFSTQLSWLHNEAIESAYSGRQSLDQAAISFQTICSFKKLETQFTLRQSIHNGEAVPLLPSADLLWSFYKSLSFRMNVAKVYRVPTLNDRYWQPGGNPNLLPEEGFTEAAALIWEKSNAKFSIKVESGVFNTKIKHTLVWIPSETGTYMAENIHEVWSRGLENTLFLSYKYKLCQYKLTLSPQYNLSTINKTVSIYNDALGKQMIYVPELLWKGMFEISSRNISIRYYHEYTGERFVTLDNKQKLPQFSTSTLLIGTEHTFGKVVFTFTFTVNNLWNENYQVIAWRAMPGRNYQAGIAMRFSK